MNNMAASKYLIYTCWSTKLESGLTIAGSLQHDYIVQTEAEAQAAVDLLAARGAEFEARLPQLCRNTVNRYTYILNRAEWWN